MTTEAYIPSQVTFRDRRIEEVFAVTLYDPDSDDPHGAMTTHHPLAEGERGPLVVLGTRDGKQWRVTLPEIEVIRRTSVGCEFIIYGRRELRIASSE
jgi:hypothetical protein